MEDPLARNRDFFDRSMRQIHDHGLRLDYGNGTAFTIDARVFEGVTTPAQFRSALRAELQRQGGLKRAQIERAVRMATDALFQPVMHTQTSDERITLMLTDRSVRGTEPPPLILRDP